MYLLLNFKVRDKFKVSLNWVVKLYRISNSYFWKDSLHNSQADMRYCCLRIDAQQHRVWRHLTVKHLTRANQTLSPWHHHPNRLRRHAHGWIEWRYFFRCYSERNHERESSYEARARKTRIFKCVDVFLQTLNLKSMSNVSMSNIFQNTLILKIH